MTIPAWKQQFEKTAKKIDVSKIDKRKLERSISLFEDADDSIKDAERAAKGAGVPWEYYHGHGLDYSDWKYKLKLLHGELE